MLWESVVAFFPRDNSLISRGKSHSSTVCGLVVRCLLFNPESSCLNPCVCAFFLQVIRSRSFSALRSPYRFRLCETFFRSFFNVPKGSPLLYLIFCNRTNVKKSQRVSSFNFFGTMRLLEIRISFENFFSLQRVPLRIFFWNFATEWMLKISKSPLFTVFGILRFLKRNNFRLKIGFLRPSTLSPIFVFFKRPVFFLCDFLKNLFSSKPPSVFTRNETFCDRKGLVKVFGTTGLTGDIQKKISKNFEQKNFPQFSVFKGFPLRLFFFALSSCGRMVFETCAYPFGYLLAL